MDNLKVYTNIRMSSQSNKRQMLEKIKNLFSGPKIIFTILGIVVLLEVVYAAKVLTSPTPSPPPTGKSRAGIQLSAGKISLITPKTNYQVAEVVPVSVMIDTGSHTIDGVDLIVRFDPKALEATTAGLTKGGILNEYPLMAVDAEAGLISISGTGSSDEGFTGTGQFATLNLRGKIPGRTSLTIDFIKEGVTTDSNIVDFVTSKDILGSVANLELNIK
ncbi:hypothetical protein A2867_00355 [Candidatus Daviesbacteria bacterium RIFCSPHIGHO2_01_FULL_40_11]|uniref:Cohesin domain-containing protein n=1 Tax=Candidatus Daviesbacteria bacterium RIFCSPHIGHO2_01_FULL_40_11 TaxID=1797762 RepID=A0A1F5JLX2_9BACT|nr:MAG: hypothetical protein A2867_00355 [Candidatus Daviesbacteria bacterium RIFCSPHIGHO2_01_FULL_40_11]OGE62610.1 MAG: hypothetical protein A2964_00245 [Candidatus Daviesbacteria bacterium RIFCSPLOWO2_01_FULL_40_27]